MTLSDLSHITFNSQTLKHNIIFAKLHEILLVNKVTFPLFRVHTFVNKTNISLKLSELICSNFLLEALCDQDAFKNHTLEIQHAYIFLGD